MSPQAEVVVVIVVTILLFGGFFAVWYFDRGRRNRRRLARTPVTRIGDTTAGSVVKVCGTVVAQEPLLIAPSGRSCVCYRVIVKRHYRRSRGGAIQEGWQNALEESAGVGFALVDESGRARVDPTGAEFGSEPHVTQLDYQKLLEPRAALLARHAPIDDRAAAQMHEHIVCPGDLLTVMGRATAGGPAREISLAKEASTALLLAVSSAG